MSGRRKPTRPSGRPSARSPQGYGDAGRKSKAAPAAGTPPPGPRGPRPGAPRRSTFNLRPARPLKPRNPDEPVRFIRTKAPARPVITGPKLVVLYEDSEVLAVDKAAGINVAIESETEVPALQKLADEYLARRGEGSATLGPRARIVHKLEKEESGVVLFAKNPRAQSILAKEWEGGKVEKVYLALVRGVPGMESGMVDAPIGRDRDKKALRAVAGIEAQSAKTRIHVLERFLGGKWSLIQARPLTGRPHQIRVHLKSIGCPLAIDELYGDSKATPPPVIERLSLHASKLTWPSPRDGKLHTAESSLPDDYRLALDALRGKG